MKRRSVKSNAAIALGIACLVSVPDASATAAAERPYIVALVSHDSAPYLAAIEGFRDRLGQLTTPVDLKTHYLHGSLAKVSRLPGELRERPPELILSLGTLATKWIVQEELESPIIAGLVLDSTLLEESTNSTGVVLDFPVKTQIDWIKKVLPKNKTIGVLFNSTQNSHRVKTARDAAESLGMRLIAKEVAEPRDLPDALKALSRRVDIIWGIPDPVVLTHQTTKPVLLFSYRNRIPFVGLSSAWVEAGALYALERDYHDLGAQCGEMALEVLRGKPVASIPVSAPRTVLLALNAKTIEHMKLEVETSIFGLATTVVEHRE